MRIDKNFEKKIFLSSKRHSFISRKSLYCNHERVILHNIGIDRRDIIPSVDAKQPEQQSPEDILEQEGINTFKDHVRGTYFT